MATTTYLILGQLDSATPGANTDGVLYTVPASTQAVSSTIVVTNRGAAAATFRLRTRKSGASDDNKQFLYYDLPLPPNETFAATIGLTLAAGDNVRVQASTTSCTFNLFGSETV